MSVVVQRVNPWECTSSSCCGINGDDFALIVLHCSIIMFHRFSFCRKYFFRTTKHKWNCQAENENFCSILPPLWLMLLPEHLNEQQKAERKNENKSRKKAKLFHMSKEQGEMRPFSSSSDYLQIFLGKSRRSRVERGNRFDIHVKIASAASSSILIEWIQSVTISLLIFSHNLRKRFFFPATVVAAVARAINTFFSVSFAKWRRRCECALVQPPMRGLSTFMGNSNSRPRYDSNLHQIQIGSFGFWWFADETTSEDEKLVNWIILIAFEHHSGPRLDGSDRGHKIGINYRALFLAFHIFRAHLMAVLRGVECVVRCPKHLHSTLNYYFQFPFHLRLYSLDRANKFAIFWQIQRKRF